MPDLSSEGNSSSMAQTVVKIAAVVGGIIFVFHLGKYYAKRRCNHQIDLHCDKIKHVVDIEDMNTERNVFCRCWRSKKFPYCDQTHVKHNEETGDNVGPLVIVKKSKILF